MSLNLGLPTPRLSYTGGCCELCFSHSIMTELRGADGLLWSSWPRVVPFLGSHEERPKAVGVCPCLPSPPLSSPLDQASCTHKCLVNQIIYTKLHKLSEETRTAVGNYLSGIFWHFGLMWENKCQACSRLGKIIGKILQCEEFHKHIGKKMVLRKGQAL